MGAWRRWKLVLNCFKMHSLLMKNRLKATAAARARWKKWEMVVKHMLGRTLRVPHLYSAHWAGDWSGYMLILERFAPQDWVTCGTRGSPQHGCSEDQASAMAGALANLHLRFLEPGKLAPFTWLTAILHDPRRPRWLQDQYSACFGRLKATLAKTIPRAAFAACERLGDCIPDLLARLGRPPCTLLHGDFR